MENENTYINTERGSSRETTRLLKESETGVGVRLYYCGSESCTPNHSFGPAIRSHYLIHFIRSGKGIYLRQGMEYSLKQGDAFLILPGETTKYMADSEDPWDYTWIAFDGAGAEPLLASCGFSNNNPVFHSDDDTKGSMLIRQAEIFESHFHDQRLNFLEILGHFYLLFSCMHTDTPGTGSMIPENAYILETNCKNASSAQRLYFHQATEYLKHNFSYPVKIEQLARYVGVSRSYLYKTFITCSGKASSSTSFSFGCGRPAVFSLKQNAPLRIFPTPAALPTLPPSAASFEKLTGRHRFSFGPECAQTNSIFLLFRQNMKNIFHDMIFLLTPGISHDII